MTTKVVKGSLWTLSGQVLPSLASLVSTPFVIRYLGSEGYGVLILVGLIPAYFTFADIGMGVVSTRFGSEAHAQGDDRREGEVVRTAAIVAMACTLLFAFPMFVFSDVIIERWFNVPESYRSVASIALKISSISFVFAILSSVINTPMLTRLRMNLNTVASAGPRVLMSVATPIVLYLGGGFLGAVWVAFGGALLIFTVTGLISSRLLPELYRPSLNRELTRPMLKMGFGLLLAAIAAILLVNLEKFFLARYVSMQSLAHYSVAFTFANVATLFSVSMIQSLLPAFTRLLVGEERSRFNALFVRSFRLNVMWLIPALMVMFVASKPFFTIWAGEEFGAASTPPFYILLIGLFVHILAIIPHSTISASGRTDLFAKLYWVELVFYAVTAFLLVRQFGVNGAAAAWSLRVGIDAFLIVYLSKRITGASLDFKKTAPGVAVCMMTVMPPVLFVFFVGNFSLWLIPLTVASLCVYLFATWKMLTEPEEREWAITRVRAARESLFARG